MMIKNNSIIIRGSAGRDILIDVTAEFDGNKKPVIIFCHGFKGYKDWGAFPLMAKYFAQAGFVCVKFNFSHNGGTIEAPIDFSDLNAFGQNNYSIELNDLGLVIDALEDGTVISLEETDVHKINLIGHSRGGGIVLLKAAEDDRVSKLVTLAGVSDFSNRFPTDSALTKWKTKGVVYMLNGRTHQQMPLFYQFYENFIENKSRLEIPSAAERLSIPYLIVHGEQDETIGVSEAKKLHQWSKKSELLLIQNTGHTFDMKQPWDSKDLPSPFQQALAASVDFLK